MKKIIFFACLTVSISACNQETKQTTIAKADTVSTDKSSIKYTCPMDADVIQNKPGKCPKCGMELVKK